MSIKIISDDQVKFSTLDAAKYAFRNEGFISALCAFFKGRKITVAEAISYSKTYNLTRLSSKLSHEERSIEIEEAKTNQLIPEVESKVTRDDINKAQAIYDNLVLENNHFKEKNDVLKKEESDQRILTNNEKEQRHQVVINATKERCDRLRSYLDQLNETIEETKNRISTMREHDE